MSIFILDSRALTAYLAKADGAEDVKEILRRAIDDGNIKVLMNKINLLEVYYEVARHYSPQEADEMLETVKELPIEVVKELSDTVLKKAGALRTKYAISLEDSVALAESIIRNGELITAHRHAFEPIAPAENVKIRIITHSNQQGWFEG